MEAKYLGFVRRKYLFTDDHTRKSFILWPRISEAGDANDTRGTERRNMGTPSGNIFITSKQICGPLTQGDRWLEARLCPLPCCICITGHVTGHYRDSLSPEWWGPSSRARLSRSRTDQNTPGGAPGLSASWGRPQTASRGRSLSWACCDRWTRPVK